MSFYLPKLADVQPLSRTIIRILGQNASPYTLQGTNCYILGSGPKRLMIDTSSPDRPDYVDLVRQVMQKESCTIEKILFTHWHPDHVGSAASIQHLLWTERSAYPTLHKFPSVTNPQAPNCEGLNFHNLRDGDTVGTEVGDVKLKVWHSPGHTDDHVCFHYPTESALFCGDLLLGHGSGVFESLPEYMRSLRLLNDRADEFTVVYSAHGEVIRRPREKIHEYVTHRMQRVEQVLQALQSLKSPAGATVTELVSAVYTEVTDPSLLLGAGKNLTQALLFLEEEGKARRSEGEKGEGEERWTAVGEVKNRL